MPDFNISDVADLLGLQRLEQGGSKNSFNVICPYCGDKRGKMNLCLYKDNREANTFHCFNCDAGGNMLDLYMDLVGFVSDNPEEKYKKTYQEIKNRLNVGIKPSIQRRKKGKEKNKEGTIMAELANEYVMNRTYRTMLDLIPLRKGHREKLLKRGLSEGDIESFHFRSTPTDTYALCRKLIKAGCTLRGVPGFFQDDQDAWNVNFYPMIAGILCPVLNVNGNIVGFQIRLDKVSDGRKYMWLTSNGKKNGHSSVSPSIFLGDKMAQKVDITEGILKAIVYYCLKEKKVTVIGVPGISNHKSGIAILQAMPNVALVNEKYDMDKLLDTDCAHDYKEIKCRDCPIICGAACPHKVDKKNKIKKSIRQLYGKVQEIGIGYKSVTWDYDKGKGVWKGNYKGIDDYEFARKECFNGDKGSPNQRNL